VMITGAIAVTVIGLVKVGGWDGLTETTQPMFLSLWRDTSDPDFPWTGIIFGAPILAVWYWCTDQFIVQRTLSAESIAAARRATIFAALLKQLPMFIFVLPGVIAYALAEKGLLQLTDPDQALPALIGALLPIGIKGLVVAGLLAALMSSLSSVFNSCATLITMDVYKKLAPNQSEARLVLVGQLSTLVMVLFGLAWIPFMDVISSQLYIYIQSVQSYISPPIAAVFLVGVIWQRANAKGAIATLSIGLVIGIARLVAEMNRESLTGGLHYFATINFLHFAVILFVVSVVILVVVSLSSAPADEQRIRPLTWQTGDGHAHADSGRRTDVILSALVLVLVVAAWIGFS